MKLTKFNVCRHRGDRFCLYPANMYASDFEDHLIRWDDLTPKQQKFKVVRTVKNYWSEYYKGSVYVIAPDSVIKENNLEPIGTMKFHGLTQYNIKHIEMMLKRTNSVTAICRELEIQKITEDGETVYSLIDNLKWGEIIMTTSNLQEIYDKINEMLHW